MVLMNLSKALLPRIACRLAHASSAPGWKSQLIFKPGCRAISFNRKQQHKLEEPFNDHLQSWSILAKSSAVIAAKALRLQQFSYPTGTIPLLLLLVTPAHISLLDEDNSFVSNILKKTVNLHSPFSQVDVIAAVVDCISFPPVLNFSGGQLQDYSQINNWRIGDGVSACILDSKTAAPDLWPNTTGILGPETKVVQKPNTISLIFQSDESKNVFSATSQIISTQVQLPLANTLFLNGLNSTLHAQKWTVDRSSPDVVVKLSKRTQLQACSVSFAGFGPTFIPRNAHSYVDLKALTPQRTVAAAMGNIVRRLDLSTNGNDTSPASKELEDALNEYLHSCTSREDYRGVWALVTPKEKRQGLVTDDFNILFRKGSRLHKVLSGGGGWGMKQGLLALDPDSGFLPQEQLLTEHQNDHNVSTGTFQHIENIVRPGDAVRFWVNTEAEGGKPTKHSSLNTSIDIQKPQSVTLGTVPLSAIETSNRDTRGPHEAGSGRCVTIRNHFGMLSENGMSMKMSTSTDSRYPTEDLICSTKLDAPNTRLSFDQPGQSSFTQEQH
ncbi:MAG: hypothetical protein Q9167_002481 [Letrouitia subvulpina]